MTQMQQQQPMQNNMLQPIIMQQHMTQQSAMPQQSMMMPQQSMMMPQQSMMMQNPMMPHSMMYPPQGIIPPFCLFVI
jgi:hypothetical protein